MDPTFVRTAPYHKEGSDLCRVERRVYSFSCRVVYVVHDYLLSVSDKSTTIPNQATETHEFTVTHPFHPLSGQTIPILSRRSAWEEPRGQYLDPETEQVRSLPLAWTSLAPSDSFVELGQGRALLRLTDLQALSARLRELSAELSAGDAIDNHPQEHAQSTARNDRWYSK